MRPDKALPDEAAGVRMQFIGTSPVSIAFGGEHSANVRFAAIAPIACADLAYLMVLHDEDRAPLSAAQIYV
ncbi:MAG: hypothetical protein EOP66_03660, partial [Sphingomonas sp.]